MKGKDIVVLSALAAGAYLIIGGGAFGASGGVGPGETKKATVISGITAPGTTPAPTFENPTPSPSPVQNFIPNPFTNPNPNSGVLPFIPSPYLMNLMYQDYVNPTASTKKELATISSAGVTFALPAGTMGPGSSLELTEYGKSLQGLGIHTQDAYLTKSANPNEELVFLGLSSNVAGGGIHAVASKKTASTITTGGQTYRSDVKPGTGSGPNSVYRTINGKRYYR